MLVLDRHRPTERLLPITKGSWLDHDVARSATSLLSAAAVVENDASTSGQVTPARNSGRAFLTPRRLNRVVVPVALFQQSLPCSAGALFQGRRVWMFKLWQHCCTETRMCVAMNSTRRRCSQIRRTLPARSPSLENTAGMTTTLLKTYRGKSIPGTM